MIEILKNLKDKYRVANFVSFITILASLAGLIIFGIWTLYPYRPLIINEKPVHIENKEIPRDGYIEYELDYCKYMDIPVTIRRRLKDGVVWALPDVVTANNKSGCRVQHFALEVPKALPSGEYIMSIEYVYKVNPIREVIVTTHTEKFSIVN